MNKYIQLKPGQSILFVCYGNTCRSPMAEGLARQIFKQNNQIESAGIAPGFEGAQEDAIIVLREEYGIEISGHKTRNINDLELDRYDWIITLDAYVHEFVKLRFRAARERMVLWEIQDPFGSPVEVYKKTAQSILRHITKFLT